MGRSISPAPGTPKPMQRGVITIGGAVTSATATISSVNTLKSRLRYLGSTTQGTTQTDAFTNVVLTNATTITANRLGNTNSCQVSWELEEVY